MLVHNFIFIECILVLMKRLEKGGYIRLGGYNDTQVYCKKKKKKKKKKIFIFIIIYKKKKGVGGGGGGGGGGRGLHHFVYKLRKYFKDMFLMCQFILLVTQHPIISVCFVCLVFFVSLKNFNA